MDRSDKRNESIDEKTRERELYNHVDIYIQPRHKSQLGTCGTVIQKSIITATLQRTPWVEGKRMDDSWSWLGGSKIKRWQRKSVTITPDFALMFAESWSRQGIRLTNIEPPVITARPIDFNPFITSSAHTTALSVQA